MRRLYESLALILIGWMALAPPLFSQEIGRASFRDAVAAAIQSMRGVHIEGQSQTQIRALNDRLDRAWDTIRRAGPGATPMLRTALSAELEKRGKPDSFFLLDVSDLLHATDPQKSEDLVVDALSRLDLDDPTMLANTERHFRLVYELARSGHEAVLPALLPFLSAHKAETFVPQHALKLDGTLMCVFLFGTYGPAAEDTLFERLKTQQAERSRILDVLDWVGTAKVLEPVSELYKTESSSDILKRSFVVLIRHGGERARKFLLETPVTDKERAFQEYYASVRLDLEAPIYENAACELRGDTRKEPRGLLTRADLDALFQKWESNYGKEEGASPLQVLNSAGAADAARFVHIRSLMLHRLSDEALSDVRITSALISGLEAKADAPGAEELQKQAQKGDATAAFRLGLRYSCGAGVTISRPEAYRYLKQAADLGFEPAKKAVQPAVITNQ